MVLRQIIVYFKRFDQILLVSALYTIIEYPFRIV